MHFWFSSKTGSRSNCAEAHIRRQPVQRGPTFALSSPVCPVGTLAPACHRDYFRFHSLLGEHFVKGKRRKFEENSTCTAVVTCANCTRYDTSESQRGKRDVDRHDGTDLSDQALYCLGQRAVAFASAHETEAERDGSAEERAPSPHCRENGPSTGPWQRVTVHESKQSLCVSGATFAPGLLVRLRSGQSIMAAPSLFALLGQERQDKWAGRIDSRGRRRSVTKLDDPEPI